METLSHFEQLSIKVFSRVDWPIPQLIALEAIRSTGAVSFFQNSLGGAAAISVRKGGEVATARMIHD